MAVAFEVEERIERSPDVVWKRLTDFVADCEMTGPLRILAPILRILIKRSDGAQLQELRSVIEAG